MAALYWVEAWVVPRGAFESRVAADPVAGYAAILAATCAAGYAVAVVHNRVHSLLSSRLARAGAVAAARKE